MKKDLLTFLVSKEAPSDELKLAVKKDIQLSFRKNVIIAKFVGYQLLGAIFSLTFCPQFGVGLNPAIDISHTFMRFGMWACAMFCGSLFLSSGVFVAFLGMKGEELWWIWRRYKFMLFFMPAILWGAFMLFGKNPGDLVYNIAWIFAAVVSVWMFYGGRSRYYLAFQHHP